MNIETHLKQTVLKYFDEVVSTRRFLHQHPEMSFQEKETCNYIISRLQDIGISDFKIMAETGIVALIKGKLPGKTVALRADIDALPIHEMNKTSYVSKNIGVMHACGHDSHTAMLLGVARILWELKDNLNGIVKLIFQPAEEKLPGGAIEMINHGVLNNPEPDYVIAQHVDPGLPCGTLGFKAGMYMASTDEFYLTVKGKGGHAAMPHEINDTVLAASHIIVALQQIVSRKAKANIPTVLSFGKVIANGATNIIPDEVKIEGTFRTMNEDWRKEVHLLAESIIQSVSAAMGVTTDVFIKKGYPYLVNDEMLTGIAKKTALGLVGKENVSELEIRMTAEDFAYFSHLKPSLMYRLGVGNEKQNINYPLHNAKFEIDERAMKTGVEYMSLLAVNLLNGAK